MPPVVLTMMMLLLGFGEYADEFRGTHPQTANPREVSVDLRYVMDMNDDDYFRFSALGGDLEMIDTGLEVLLALYYSQGVVQPDRARNILGTPREADLKFGHLLLSEIQVLRFLGNTAAVSRHETMLQWIISRGNVTRAQIETFYRNGIRALISEIVTEEFNQIRFLLDDSRYNAILARNPQTGQYVLGYEGFFDGTRATKELPPVSSLEALSSAMSRSGDFSATAFAEVRTQAALMPAVVYANWRPNGVDAMALITETLTNFYINPNRDTFNAVRGIYSRYTVMMAAQDRFAGVAAERYVQSLNALNVGLTRQVINESGISAARIPNDPRFNIFSTPYR